MCMGIPMQVLDVSPGFAQCDRPGPHLARRHTALIDPPSPGDWLLVFLDSAREIISAERAAEVDATLDLVADAMGGLACGRSAHPTPGFDLPSAMSAEQLAALAGVRH